MDFKKGGYIHKGKADDVKEPGDFFIDENNREIIIKLKPAIYPHHILGITEDHRVVNICIAGLSGRSGITIDGAKSLCKKIGLSDAIILDNGNDVITRFNGGNVICHKLNTRKTRLTAALHFGFPRKSNESDNHFEGFEFVYGTCDVSPTVQ